MNNSIRATIKMVLFRIFMRSVTFISNIGAKRHLHKMETDIHITYNGVKLKKHIKCSGFIATIDRICDQYVHIVNHIVLTSDNYAKHPFDFYEDLDRVVIDYIIDNTSNEERDSIIKEVYDSRAIGVFRALMLMQPEFSYLLSDTVDVETCLIFDKKDMLRSSKGIGKEYYNELKKYTENNFHDTFNDHKYGYVYAYIRNDYIFKVINAIRNLCTWVYRASIISILTIALLCSLCYTTPQMSNVGIISIIIMGIIGCLTVPCKKGLELMETFSRDVEYSKLFELLDNAFEEIMKRIEDAI